MNHPPIQGRSWCGMNVTILADSLALEIKEKHTVDKFIFPCPKILIAAHQACAWVSKANEDIVCSQPYIDAMRHALEWRKWAEEQSK